MSVLSEDASNSLHCALTRHDSFVPSFVLTSRLSQVPEQHKAVNMGHQCCLVTGSTHAKEIKNT